MGNCGQQNCNVRRVISRSTGKVHSFSRGCSIKPPQSTKCSNDVYFTTCETICSTDNCNVKETLPTYKPKSTTKRHSYNNAGGSGIVAGRAVATSRCFVAATPRFSSFMRYSFNSIGVWIPTSHNSYVPKLVFQFMKNDWQHPICDDLNFFRAVF